MRLYFDASTIIYSVERVPPFRTTVVERIEQVEQTSNGAIITSRLSRLECRIKPLRDGSVRLLEQFDEFFRNPLVRLVDVNASIIEQVTELRAQYGFKTPDAIHLATAIGEGADRFLTGDESLRRCTEVEVEVLRA